MKSIYDEEYRATILRLADRRRQLGLTQKKLAERLGWEQSVISKVEKYVRRLDLIEAKRFCEALGWNFENLFRDFRNSKGS